jgi:hypothetical protein
VARGGWSVHQARTHGAGVYRIGDSYRRAGVPDAVWTDLTHCFDDTEIVRLLIAVAAINVWNRIAISTHQQLPDLDPSAG